MSNNRKFKFVTKEQKQVQNLQNTVSNLKKELNNYKQRKNKRNRNKKGPKKPPKQVDALSMPLGEGYRAKIKNPKFTNKGAQVIVRHSEYVMDINGSTETETTRLRVNPGDGNTFPWLSRMAGSYEKFKIRKMSFRYIKNCASITEGFVWMYPDYDVNDPIEQQKAVFLNMMDVVQGSAWTNLTLNISPAKFNQTKSYLIRSPYQVYNDYLLYDPVNVMVGTEGTGDPISIGKIFVDYEIELMIPDPQNGLHFDNCFIVSNNVTINNNVNGLYIPQPVTGNITNQYGNIQPTATQTGWTLTSSFCGYMTIYIIGENFDASRVLNMAVDQGTLTVLASNIQDEFGGTDIWSKTWALNAPQGANVNFTSSLTTGLVNTAALYLIMSSANPKWLLTVDPKLNPPVLKKTAKRKPNVSKILELLDSESEYEFIG
jgi:hypothetical protein